MMTTKPTVAIDPKATREVDAWIQTYASVIGAMTAKGFTDTDTARAQAERSADAAVVALRGRITR